jgi:hypothetical protein
MIKIYKPIVESKDGRGSIIFVFEKKDVKGFKKGTIFLAKGNIWEVMTNHQRPWYFISKKLREREEELKAFYVRKVSY